MVNQTIEKKIAYVLTSYNAAQSGVYKKILDQVTFWKSCGYKVRLFVITDVSSVSYWQRIDPEAIILLSKNPLVRLHNRFRIIELAIASMPSIIYLRDSFPIRIPESLIPVIIEVQSLVGQELRIRNRIKYHFFELSKKYFYSQVAGVIYVSRELLMINEFGIRDDIPKKTISNGINLSRIKALPEPDQSKSALLFLGSPTQKWSGIPELIEFGRANPDIDIHIVGDIVDPVLPNVFLYGLLSSNEYYTIASKCIAGVGSLNLQAKKMKEASPLKVREYLALGLPVILKYQDTDLETKDSFVLQLPTDGRPLVAFESEIRAFLEKWSTKRVTKLEIVDIDIANKEASRLEFFEEIMIKGSVHNLRRGPG